MKLLADFLPVLLFFITYFLGNAAPQRAHQIATALLSGLVKDGAIPVDLASILLASAVAIVAITVQIAYMLARRRKIGTVQWVTFVIFLIFGGATIYFHNDAFIKWKPTVLYWLFALVLLISSVFLKRNLIRAAMEVNGVHLPEPIWHYLNLSWIAFFALTGLLNLYVAFHLSRNIWVSFKSFGLTALTLIFVVGQSLFLARHLEPEPAATANSSTPPPP